MPCALPFPTYTLQTEIRYCSGAPFPAALQVSQLLFLRSQVQMTPTQTFQFCQFGKQLQNNNKWFLKEGKRSHSLQVFIQAKLSTISLLMLEEELGVPVAPWPLPWSWWCVGWTSRRIEQWLGRARADRLCSSQVCGWCRYIHGQEVELSLGKIHQWKWRKEVLILVIQLFENAISSIYSLKHSSGASAF